MQHSPRRRRRLGEWLVERQLINRSELFHALSAAFLTDCRVGDALVGLGYVRRPQVELEARRLRHANSAVRQSLTPLPLSRPRRSSLTPPPLSRARRKDRRKDLSVREEPQWAQVETQLLRRRPGNPCMSASGTIDTEDPPCSGVIRVRVPHQPAIEIKRRSA